MQHPPESPRREQPSAFAAFLPRAIVLAAAMLVAPTFAATPAPSAKQATASVPAAAGKNTSNKKPAPPATASKKPNPKAGTATAARKPGPLADFGTASASPEVVHIANWVSYTRNNGKHAFVVIDKKLAQLYVFSPQGKLKSHTPVLLGKAVGDTTAPGIGNLPLSKIPDDQKTTPAGRFLVERGLNNHGDDVFWIDYKAAVSMHRMHSVSAAEHRADRMATEDSSDNRISNGCVNLPAKFYDSVLKPTLMKQGAFVYVLPETTTPQQVFGSYDVRGAGKRVQVASR